jgi:outer membrane protein assembly factor BamA
MRRRTVALVFAFSAAAAVAHAQRTPAGHAVTGIPALNFDSDEGLGYGALLQYYDYGDHIEPYRYTLQPTLFLTTKGRRDVGLFVDAPHLLPNGWRLGASFAREQQLATPYYGIGNDTRVSDGATAPPNRYFYRYGRRVLRANLDLQHAVGASALRALVGVGARSVVANTVPFDEGTTLLAQSLGAGQLPAVDTRYLRLGLVWDSRDREIGTHRGTWAELLIQQNARVLGATESFTRTTATVREFLPIAPRLTIAERVVVQDVSGAPSFTEMSVVQGSYRDDEALGGSTSLRGIPKNRYLGKGIAFANNELRWDAARFILRDRPARLVLNGFVDTGRVWDGGVQLRQAFTGLHTGYGGGARLALGPTFVVGADVGHSSESAAAVYVGLGYLF